MDKVILRNVFIKGCHGCYIEEETTPQPFCFNLDIYTDLTKACASDNIEDTISYADVFTQIETIVTQKQFRLLEKLGETVCNALFKNFSSIQKIRLELTKPEAPINGQFETVGIEITRER